RWDLHGWVVIHRIGRLRPGEQIVLAATAAAHRQAAFDACHFIMDWLKTDAPFWKQVHFADGSTSWIEAEERDRKERDSWG
ncbi:MAG: molybdenum cofactor biosynthesis protein MoaE, partial [Pseudomonadota bacterium]